MGNLIIKGKGGAGNKLIIQDQAGAAVLTTADSGATLGNSTQDNITRLGTVTSGTLASTTTFPAGHVIQTTARPTKLQTHVTGGTYTASDCYHNITTTSGNYVLVTAACPINLYIGSAAVDSAAMVMQIHYSTNGSSFAFMPVGDGTDKSHGGSNHNYNGNLPAGWNHQEHQTMTFLHGPVSGTTHYYKVYIKYTGHTGTGHAAIMNPDSNRWGGMTLMEIQA